ncbi:MAG: Crp/Fnr family transcriptional regulator [Terriglobia bacterium]
MSDQIPYNPPAPAEAPSAPPLTTLQKADLIHGISVFSELTVEELYRLAAAAKIVGFPAGTVIFRQNDAAIAFYIVLRGEVELTRQGRDDRKVVGAERAVGIYPVLTQEPCPTRATALEDTVAIAIGAEDFFSLLSNNPEIVAGIFRHFVRKLNPESEK